MLHAAPARAGVSNLRVRQDDDKPCGVGPRFRSGGLRAARRRRARRFHLGRARSPARGALVGHRRHLGYIGGRDECRGAGRWLCRRRRRRRARRAGEFLAPGLAGSGAQPVPAQSAGRAAGPLDARLFADVRRHGHDGARVLTLRPQPERRQSPAQRPGRGRRFRPADPGADQAVRHRHQCPHRARPRVPQRRDHAGRAAGIGLPADHVPGDRDRWRKLLGRRLFRQSDHHAAGTRMPLARYDPRADQSGRARGHRRARRAISSTGSTRSRSMPCCSRSCG